MRYLFLITLIAASAFCGLFAPSSTEMVELSSSTLEIRQIQTKRFDTNDTTELLSASVAVLQDMGFNVDEINKGFGVVTASKTRDATEVGQQVGAFLASALFGGDFFTLTDSTQTIKVSVVVMPVGRKSSIVRMSVMRILYNYKGASTGVEVIKDQAIYEGFFQRLSKSIFLEANKI